jgi:hypothetical protein
MTNKNSHIYQARIVLGMLKPDYGVYGERVELKLELRTRTGEYNTIDHRTITEYTELAISGDIFKGRNMVAGGQCTDSIRDVTKFKKLFVPAKNVERIVEIWDRWHLNSLNAGCIHQNNVSFGTHYKENAEIETKKCPLNYKYGSNWLIEELPKEIENEIKRLFTTE